MKTKEIKIKKLLFLDIDGVMTSIVDGTSLWNCDPSSYSLSSNATENLFSILESGDVKVVIHSSWVKYRNIPDYEYVYISPLGMRFAFKSLLFNLIELLSDDGCYMGCTHHVSGRDKKGDIEEWLENNKSMLDPGCKIAILDDDPNMNLDKVTFDGHDIMFCRCDTRLGLTDRDVDEVKSFLK